MLYTRRRFLGWERERQSRDEGAQDKVWKILISFIVLTAFELVGLCVQNGKVSIFRQWSNWSEFTRSILLLIRIQMDNLTISPWRLTLRHTQATKVFISRTLMDCCPFSEEKEWPKVCSRRIKETQRKKTAMSTKQKAVLSVLGTEHFIHFYCVVMGAHIANWVWVLREWQGKKLNWRDPKKNNFTCSFFSFFVLACKICYFMLHAWSEQERLWVS